MTMGPSELQAMLGQESDVRTLSCDMAGYPQNDIKTDPPSDSFNVELSSRHRREDQGRRPQSLTPVPAAYAARAPSLLR